MLHLREVPPLRRQVQGAGKVPSKEPGAQQPRVYKKLVRPSDSRDSNLEAPDMSQSLNADPAENRVPKLTTPISNEADLNSYKFARPRVYVKNDYESADASPLDHLKFIASNIGPKKRTPAYNQLIEGNFSSQGHVKARRRRNEKSLSTISTFRHLL